MSERKYSPLTRLLPSLTDVAFLLPIIFLFLRADGAKTLLGDGDTGWHIRTGEWILDNGRVPYQDLFSFTKPGQPWFAWEWLSDVLFGWLHRQGGLAAIVIVGIAILGTTFALVYRLARRKSGNVLLAIGVTVLAVAGSMMHWLARPHLFTFLFTALFCFILERAREAGARRLWLLPVLTVFWTNLHGGFFVGLLLIGAYAAGELATWLLDPDQETRRAALARSKPYLLAGLGCFAATFCNPYFYRLHVHIYQYFADAYHFLNIQEFQSADFHHGVAFFFETMIGLGVVAIVWNFYQRRFAYCFLLGGWIHLGLISVRNVPLMLIVAAPVVAATMEELLALLPGARVAGWLRSAATGMSRLAEEFGVIDRLPRVYLAGSAVLVLLAAGLYLPLNSNKFRAEFDPKQFPAKAVELVRAPDFGGKIFATDQWGDYLIYRLYPKVRVFIDGRSDFYGSKFGENYLDIMRGKYTWEAALQKHGVDTVLLSVNDSLASTLKQSCRWRTVYDDGVAVMFRKSGGDSQTARGLAPGSPQYSAVSNSGMKRDRPIANTPNGDRKATTNYARRERS